MATESTTSSTVMLKKKQSSPLIVDPDSGFVDTIWGHRMTDAIPPVVSMSGQEAQKILAQFKQPFSGIFINPSLDDINPLALVKSAHHYHAGVPIYFLCDAGFEGLSNSDLQNMGIQKKVQKPVGYDEIIKLVTPSVMYFDPKVAIKVGAEDTAPLDTEVDAGDDQFFAVRAENFFSGKTIYFDVYVKVGSGRYLKLLKAGDAFSLERITSYVKKGVAHFYLKKNAQEHYLNYCDKLVGAIVQSPKIATEIKVAQTYHHGEETLSFLKNSGVNKSSIEYATGFISNLENLILQSEFTNNQVIGKFIKDIGSYEHGVGTSMIACLIAHYLGFSNEKAVHVIGMSSLLHDVGLLSHSDAVRKEDESLMNPQEKLIYANHPITGSKIVSELPQIDPIVAQIISQHHERVNRSGFPKKLGRGVILQMAEVVGMSDELFKLFQKSKENSSINPLLEMESTVDYLFSKVIGVAFRAVFLGKKE
jgi:hypothetical protein